MKVTAIPGENFRYQVQSKSNPNQTHMVDLADSQCSCISWTCHNKEYKKRTGRAFECCHQKAAWEQLKDDIKAKYGTKSK